jgi:hypothetical protein
MEVLKSGRKHNKSPSIHSSNQDLMSVRDDLYNKSLMPKKKFKLNVNQNPVPYKRKLFSPTSKKFTERRPSTTLETELI